MADDLEKVVRQVIAPLLRADGAEVYLVELTALKVHLHLAGRFAGCPGNTLAKNRVLEPALRAAEPEVEFELTSGAIIPPGAIRL